MHNNNFELFVRHGLNHIKAGSVVLELGPDWTVHKGRCRPLVVEKGASYHFADLNNKNSTDPEFVRMYGPYCIGSASGLFDAVFSLSVVEHVPKIWRWMEELCRVVKRDGIIICVNPVSWPFHPSPVDCWRILPDGYKALFEDFGIEYVFGWHGNIVQLEDHLLKEHGRCTVTDTIAIGRKK